MSLRRFREELDVIPDQPLRGALSPSASTGNLLGRELRLQSARLPLLKVLANRIQRNGEGSVLRPRVVLATVGPMTTMISVPAPVRCRLLRILQRAG